MSETAGISKIHLDGDWSMAGVAEKFSALSSVLNSLLDSQLSTDPGHSAAPVVPEIDLSGITGFDACGCQLLVLFVRKLRQHGISAQLTNFSDALKSSVYYFGFDRELNLPL